MSEGLTNPGLQHEIGYVSHQAIEDLLYRLIGRNVRDARDAAGATQEDLAEAIGVTRTSITNLERGEQRPPLHRLLRLARSLEVSLTDLVPSWSELEREMSERQLEGRPESEKLVREVRSEEG